MSCMIGFRSSLKAPKAYCLREAITKLQKNLPTACLVRVFIKWPFTSCFSDCCSCHNNDSQLSLFEWMQRPPQRANLSRHLVDFVEDAFYHFSHLLALLH